MITHFGRVRHADNEVIYRHLLDLWKTYYRDTMASALRKPVPAMSKEENDRRAADAEAIHDIIHHFEEVHDLTEPLGRFFTGLGSNLHPGSTTAGLESHNGLMKGDQDWKRLKIMALLKALATFVGLESYRADPAHNGRHSISWTRKIKPSMYKLAWHKWDAQKAVFDGLKFDELPPIFAIPLAFPHTIQPELVKCAAERYGKWPTITSACADLEMYGFVSWDPDQEHSTCTLSLSLRIFTLAKCHLPLAYSHFSLAFHIC